MSPNPTESHHIYLLLDCEQNKNVTFIFSLFFFFFWTAHVVQGPHIDLYYTQMHFLKQHSFSSPPILLSCPGHCPDCCQILWKSPFQKQNRFTDKIQPLCVLCWLLRRWKPIPNLQEYSSLELYPCIIKSQSNPSSPSEGQPSLKCFHFVLLEHLKSINHHCLTKVIINGCPRQQ